MNSSLSLKDDEKNATRLRTLLAEVDSAAAMLALAEISPDPDTVRLIKESARQSYQAAMHLILGMMMSDHQERQVWNALAPSTGRGSRRPEA
jgi:hypothetical protein